MYNLKNISLYDHAFFPGQHPGSNLGIAGFLDLPSRLGKTFHDWASEDGIEPYVSAADIANGGFGGRDIDIIGLIKGVNRTDCENKRLAITSIFDSATDLMPLQTNWGTHNVLIRGAVTSTFLSDKFLSINIPLREPLPDLSGVSPIGDHSQFGIDGISFKNLGGVALELSGDRRNRPAPKGDQVSSYGKESYIITKTVASELTMKLFIEQPTFAAFKSKITGLYALFNSPGLRSITINNDRIRSFFVKDGFKVTNLYSLPQRFCGVVECKLTQSGTPTRLEDLTINGAVVSINGQTIKVRVPINI
jgi:hypothetical protein